MEAADPNAPVPSLEDFFGNGISLAQYERKDDPLVQQKQREFRPMNVDLLDMNAFVMDDEDEPANESDVLNTKVSDGSDTNSTSAAMTTDFLEDDEVGLRDHSEAQVLTPVANPYNQAEKPKINLVRDEGQESFIQQSWVWRFLSCINLGDYGKYFDVSTKEVVARLRYTLIGHFTNMPRPSNVAQGIYQGVSMQSQDQTQKPDFDLYAPFWLMITLVVECSIIGLLNQYISAYWAGDYDANNLLNVQFSAGTISSLFFFLLVFFAMPPLAIYFFARLKLLDASTKFWRLFSTLGYSYASYVPAILLTLIGIDFLKWIFVALACGNQLFGLYKQSEELVPTQTQQTSDQLNAKQLTDEERANLVKVMRVSLLVSQLIFALCLKMWFVQ